MWNPPSNNTPASNSFQNNSDKVIIFLEKKRVSCYKGLIRRIKFLVVSLLAEWSWSLPRSLVSDQLGYAVPFFSECCFPRIFMDTIVHCSFILFCSSHWWSATYPVQPGVRSSRCYDGINWLLWKIVFCYNVIWRNQSFSRSLSILGKKFSNYCKKCGLSCWCSLSLEKEKWLPDAGYYHFVWPFNQNENILH